MQKCEEGKKEEEEREGEKKRSEREKGEARGGGGGNYWEEQDYRLPNPLLAGDGRTGPERKGAAALGQSLNSRCTGTVYCCYAAARVHPLY